MSHKTIQHWVDQYADALYSWAVHKVNDTHLGEDLVQETFLAAFKSYDRFEGKSHPKTWLFSILNRKIIDYYRKKASQERLNPTNDNPHAFFDTHGNWQANGFEDLWTADEHLLDSLDFQEVFQRCMNHLSASKKAVLEAKYLVGKKAEDICKELEITPSNYWQLLHRGKLSLKNCLETHWFA